MARPKNLTGQIEASLHKQLHKLSRRSLIAKGAFLAIEIAVIAAAWLKGWEVAGIVAAIAATIGGAYFIVAEHTLNRQQEIIRQSFDWVKKREQELDAELEYYYHMARAAQIRLSSTPPSAPDVEIWGDDNDFISNRYGRS